MNAPTDEQLLREYLQGKAASFELLVRRHTQELFQFVVRFTGESLAAEDVVQETFLQVHTSAASFDPARRFKPWLFTIAANKARDYLRRRNRRQELPFEARLGGEEDTGRRFLDLLAIEDRSADDDLLMEEKRGAVRSAVETMPVKLREVLVLAYYHRFPYKEIAEILDVPVGTIKSRLHAAIASFRDAYEAIVKQKTGNEP